MRAVADIQADLTAFYAGRRALATGTSYSLDTGQGRYTVTRANLPDINRTIAELEAELAEAQEPGGDILHIQVDR